MLEGVKRGVERKESYTSMSYGGGGEIIIIIIISQGCPVTGNTRDEALLGISVTRLPRW